MEKLNLRPLEPEDLDILYSIENDMELWTVGYTSAPYSRYLLRDYIAKSTCDIYADRQVRLIAEDSSRNVVGIVDLSAYEPQHNRAEIGLVVIGKYRNKGYGREIVEMVADYGRRIIHLHQLYAVINPSNEAALAMFRSVGFSHSVTLPSWIYDGEKYADAMFLQLFL